ncbi:integral membrane protein PTH11-like protein [Aspergillus flavus]|nr:integral membrane protein PTH11-like protein [Aspergillus flavus]
MVTVTDIFGPQPPGIDLNDNQTPQINATVIALYIVAVIAVILRFVTRIKVQRISLGIDDWLIAASLLQLYWVNTFNIISWKVKFQVADCCQFSAGYCGLGKHVWRGTLDDVVNMRKILFAYIFIYLVLLPSIKVSIILLYRRIFGMNWMMWLCLALSIGHGACCMVAFLCSCRPLSYFYTQFADPSGGKCIINLYAFYLGNAATNVFTDVITLLVPIPIISRLQIRPMQKVLISGIFLLGGFVSVGSMVRIYYLTLLATNPDINWVMGDVYLWSTIEPCIGIVCACLPTLNALLRRTTKLVLGSNAERLFGSFPLSASRRKRRDKSQSKSRSFQQLDGNEATPNAQLRPEDEIVLMTVSAHSEPNSYRRDTDSVVLMDDSARMAITVKHDFDWSEDHP